MKKYYLKSAPKVILAPYMNHVGILKRLTILLYWRLKGQNFLIRLMFLQILQKMNVGAPLDQNRYTKRFKK